MSLTSRLSRINKQVLVLVLLLSYLGQAFAAAGLCNMASGNEPLNASSELNMASPCHQMMSEADVQSATESSRSMDLEQAMDCCDLGNMVNNHDCSCPDGGCSGSLSFASSLSANSGYSSEAAVCFTSARFSSQISSALFRPPIA